MMTRLLAPALLTALAVEPAFAAGQRLPSLPDKEGFAGMYAGTSHGALLAGGGANFPDKRPWQGGKKTWYDAVFALERPDGEWKPVGKLPRPLAYGISVTYGDRVVCIGGSDADRHYGDAFALEWKDGKLITHALPALPRPIANAGGALLGDTVFIAGGQEKPDATAALKCVFALDLSAPEPKWREVDSWPGPSRLLATAAGFDGALWIAGGADLFEGKDGKSARRYLKDAYRFDPKGGWKRIADLPCPIVAPPAPAPADTAGFYLLGGDEGTDVGFMPPEKHPGFRKQILRYDAASGAWKPSGELPAVHATAPLVRWRDMWVVISGEVRPGIRSPEVWSVSLKR
jgi:N-acetylneuraminate epimerase